MDCGNCRKSARCNFIGADWFSPCFSGFCTPFVIFYLVNCEDIRDGKWPAQPNGSHYTDPAIRSKATKLPSRAAEETAAEMDSRLTACGFAGLALEAYYRDMLTIRQLASYHHCTDDEMHQLIHKALAYCTGKKHRKTLFKDF
jgi:hypothetical protein